MRHFVRVERLLELCEIGHVAADQGHALPCPALHDQAQARIVVTEVERNDRDALPHERACDPRADAAEAARDEPAFRGHASW